MSSYIVQAVDTGENMFKNKIYIRILIRLFVLNCIDEKRKNHILNKKIKFCLRHFRKEHIHNFFFIQQYIKN